MHEYQDPERDELVKRFRDYLSENRKDNSFNENDIIEIFDYAGDLNDDYVRAEALFYGARYYPNSDELCQRRLLFYNDNMEDVAGQYLADHGGDSPDAPLLQRLISIELTHTDTDDAIIKFEKLINKSSHVMNDEETIRFVDTAGKCGCLDWVYDNLQTIGKHTSNYICLVYELAMSYIDIHDYTNLESLFETLVSEKPFEISYWESLLIAQLENKDTQIEKLEDTIETILAMDPTDEDALKAKAKIEYDNNCTPEKLSEIASLAPDCIDIQRLYIRTYINSIDKKDAIKYLQDRILNNDCPIAAVIEYLEFDSRSANAFIRRNFTTDPIETISLQDWYAILFCLNNASAKAKFNLTDTIISYYDDEIPYWWKQAYLINAFYLGKYDIIVDRFKPTELDNIDKIELLTMLVYCLAKTGNFSSALTISLTVFFKPKEFWFEQSGTDLYENLLFGDAKDIRQDILIERCREILKEITARIEDAMIEDKTPNFKDYNPFVSKE